MIMNQIFATALILSTSSLLYLFATRKLRLRKDILRQVAGELLEYAGSGIVFLGINIALGMFAVIVLRVSLQRFVSLYLLGNPEIVLLSVVQGFLFQMWWRRSVLK